MLRIRSEFRLSLGLQQGGQGTSGEISVVLPFACLNGEDEPGVIEKCPATALTNWSGHIKSAPGGRISLGRDMTYGFLGMLLKTLRLIADWTFSLFLSPFSFFLSHEKLYP